MFNWLLLLAVAIFTLSAPARGGHHLDRRHSHSLAKRSFTAPATYYIINNGNQVACGGFYQPGDFVIAMNVPMFQGSCGKTVTITYQGKKTTATVVDECEACASNGYGGIDLTQGLFEFFAPTSVGEIEVTWWFGSDPPPPPPPKTTSTSTKHTTSTSHKPTSTPPPPPPTTTSTSSTSHKPTSTSSSSSSSSEHKSKSSTSTSSTEASAPTLLPGPNNVWNLQQAYLGLGKAVVEVSGSSK